MRQRQRPLVLASCAASTAAALVVLGLIVAPGDGTAQEVPPPPESQPGAALAPMLGGRLPTPDLPVTITWDSRFKPVETKAAVVGPYVVIEGDMIVGTTDDVSNALLNEAISAAQEFEKSPDKDAGLPPELRESVARISRQLAQQPKQQTRLAAPTEGRAEAQRLLQAVRRFKAAQRVLRSDASAPAAGVMTKGADEALDQFVAAARAMEPGDEPAPPEEDPARPVAQALALLDTRFYWPDGVVPYFIDRSYEPFRARFEAATRLWMDQTDAVKFRPFQPGDRNYLYVKLVGGDAGSSNVGMVPGGQWLNLLHPDRFPEPHISHELGHALGLFHEQSRPDRGSHLALIERNIQPGWISQFTTPVQEFTTLGTGFDYFSIMLYDSRAGSVNPNAVDGSFRPTFPVYSIPKAWQDFYRTKFNFNLTTDVIGLGNVKKPSRYDVAAVNRMYGPAAKAAAAAAPASLAPAAPIAPGGDPPPPEPPFPSTPASVGFAPMLDAPAAALASAPSYAAPSLAAPPAVTVVPGGVATSGSITVTVTIPYPQGAAPAGGAPAPDSGAVDATEGLGGGEAAPPVGGDEFSGPAPPPGSEPPARASSPASAPTSDPRPAAPAAPKS
ncbi:M12 family metallopeptidase [Paludisphaera soli]|uniref:M12 family metallopeptidase n=1 Tax=Paludisphaera soli TaxID=2712865 RepID=UPI0013EBFD4A|nr:M12 family metallopeptidase [Paludisphaera soli]